jgi:NAD(P)-dependent dehydrogenase (short-subunit alcohol dehydrogenase family)
MQRESLILRAASSLHQAAETVEGTQMIATRSNGKHNGHVNGHAGLEPGRFTSLEPPLAEPLALGRPAPGPLALAKGYRPAGKLTGKVAIITGADSDLGRAVAQAYAREGADVAILYAEDDAAANDARQAVEDAGRRAVTIRGDVADEAFCQGAVEQVERELGRIDILVSNAAVRLPTDDVMALRAAQLERTFRVNVFGYLFMVQACLPRMAPGGAIIATGSETGIFGSDRLPDYSATQGAVHALTRSLAQQLLPRGIRVNAIAGQPPRTPERPDADDTSARAGHAAGRGGTRQPVDLAPAYVFLASNADSRFITGQVLTELETGAV